MRSSQLNTDRVLFFHQCMTLTLLAQCATIFLSLMMLLGSCNSLTGRISNPDLKNIPPGDGQFGTGTTFLKHAPPGGPERERAIYNEVSKGNIPHFLRSMKPVTIEWVNAAGKKQECVFRVLPDYLAIGSDSDYVRIPMTAGTAQQIADLTDTLLPSTKMVDAIYTNAGIKLEPQPLPNGPQMSSNEDYLEHNRIIEQQLLKAGANLGDLIAGHKKDLVITNLLDDNPDRAAIYGWHRMEDGKPVPIQPLSTEHPKDYVDYSHGVRLVSKEVLIDGKTMSIVEVLSDPELSRILSDEGPIKDIRVIR